MVGWEEEEWREGGLSGEGAGGKGFSGEGAECFEGEWKGGVEKGRGDEEEWREGRGKIKDRRRSERGKREGARRRRKVKGGIN